MIKKLLLFLTLLGYAGLLFVFNEKSYILVTLLVGVSFFFVTHKQILPTLFFLILFSLPFEKGIRGWNIPAVLPGPEEWITGYQFYFGISLKFIFILTTALLLAVRRTPFFDLKKFWNKTFSLTDTLLFLFLLWSVVSTFFSADFFVSVLGVMRVAMCVLLYFLSKYFFQEKLLRDYFPLYLTGVLFLMGMVGTMQFFAGHFIGFFLEEGALSPFGTFTTDSDPLYRIFGLSGHPTFFGSQLSLLLPPVIGLFLIEHQKQKKTFLFYLLAASVLLGVIALIGTFSRSGWVALGFALCIFWQRRFISRSVATLLALSGGSFFILWSTLLLSRLRSIFDFFTTGNFIVRNALMNETWPMIFAAPLLGVGLNRFTQVMASHDLPDNLLGFLYPVHNTFLLFFAELGIIGGGLFAFFAFHGTLSQWHRVKENPLKLGVFLGCCTFLINAQFHTLFNQDASLDIFMILIAFLHTV